MLVDCSVRSTCVSNYWSLKLWWVIAICVCSMAALWVCFLFTSCFEHQVDKVVLVTHGAWCKTFLVKMSFICMRMKNDFHIKGRAPTLVLKQRPGGTRKWPILGFFPIHYVNLVLLQINLPLHKSACFGKKKWIGRLNSETSRTS